MTGAEGPYVVPVNYGYDGTHIWIHCAEAGHTLDLLAERPARLFRGVCGRLLDDREGPHRGVAPMLLAAARIARYS
jgi:hypothetical protein